ncbi:hypothetical protein ACHAAC_09250 [Aeromicrobium sp. CF4.19]|uniref:hypothetical protein n=1 Tax=Aeromicrobium sp. CF4.19 TaxID=3373082 RepID=UPI003EE4C8DA
MNIIRRLAVGALGAVAATTAVTAVTLQPAAAFDECDLSTKVDELKGWDTNNDYNIIVWKGSAIESSNLEGVVVSDSERKTPCEFTNNQADYHWAIFESGEFVRKGDGGYRNWAFYGAFDREGDNKVVFHSKK